VLVSEYSAVERTIIISANKKNKNLIIINTKRERKQKTNQNELGARPTSMTLTRGFCMRTPDPTSVCMAERSPYSLHWRIW